MSHIFISCLLCLCTVMLIGFIFGVRKKSLALLVCVPLLACGVSVVYFSYKSVLGYAYRATWEVMPERFTVIYFRAEGKKSITLWLFDKGTTRLVELPFSKEAEDAMEGGRKTMGEGTPVTFRRKSKSELQQESEGEECELDGEGKSKGKDKRGWVYIIESEGDPIPGDGMPPK